MRDTAVEHGDSDSSSVQPIPFGGHLRAGGNPTVIRRAGVCAGAHFAIGPSVLHIWIGRQQWQIAARYRYCHRIEAMELELDVQAANMTEGNGRQGGSSRLITQFNEQMDGNTEWQTLEIRSHFWV